MAVYSMTGYASAQLEASATDADSGARPARLGIEIRSVNSRFLDLSFRLPDELRAQEPGLRALVTQHLKRGKVEVRASIESEAQGLIAPPSARMLQQLNSAQDSVRAWLPSAAPLSVADALRLCAGSSASSASWSPEDIQALAQRALEDLVAAREREGKRLSAMLQDRLKQLRGLARQATPLVPQLVDQQRQRFLERWKEAMALAEGVPVPEAAQDRALAEATAFAIRIDVAEEITRLDSHLDEIERLLKKGGEIGKRLDFLIQELHREANTLGSKSAAMDLTRISVDMKVLIEQMREQVQNIE
ncbi:YicC family protein [Acidovorax sp. NCPPB 3859]|nr:MULTISPECIES: YicC/YloC family endoribonuclease [unclassified Acidovorax]MDA8450403.1 YicC family protein [Acidovorax sp. GBBC 3297]MDA8459923.1 YicC family protein [Acidovorax sp. GBBC 3333]MDA8464959.1 YicC family protein [Acidovorax sp. GBBC 3332]MDA8469918.1 YicC family protein [Acidovorax sp. GBBC 3299]WCM77485.1 YicC family protein [Acidovorax sp. GBBC 712]